MDQPAFDLEQIRAIIALAAEADLAELTVESERLKVSVKRGSLAPAQTAPRHAPASAREEPRRDDLPGAVAAAAENHFEPITAPMVGTFYRSSNPDAAPFVEEGDEVHPGQTVCIIEAMKLFNEIQAEVGGRVARVLAENGAPVEYGQPLFLIDPSANGS